MFQKLEQVEARFEEITSRLSAPDLEVKEIQDLAKEQAGLRELVETYREFKSAKKQIEENKALLETESDAEMTDMIKEELSTLEASIPEFEQKLKVLLIPRDPLDEKNIILEIRAGTGGEEAGLFCGDLFRMYSRFAERQGWKVEILSSNPTGKGGFKEVVAMIRGDDVYSKLKFEGGTHRVQRIPQTESGGRIHTSACTVAILPEAEDVEIDVKEADLRIDVFRAGGAGGQHVNTTDSAVRITHNPTGLVVICQDEKSQHKNKAKAMKVLKARLFDKIQQEQRDKESAERKTMVGSGDRSEKIRTYNYPQSRVTDHRIGLTLQQLDAIMDGDLTEVLESLITSHQAESLKNIADN